MVIKLSSKSISTDNPHLSKEKEYTVYEFETLNGENFSFSIIDDLNNKYLSTYPADIFIVVDSRKSKYWKKFRHPKFDDRVVYSFINWSTSGDPLFFDRAINESSEDLETLLRFKKLIDFEFADSRLPSVEIFNEGWLLCPICFEGWKDSSEGELVECPSGHKLNRN